MSSTCDRNDYGHIIELTVNAPALSIVSSLQIELSGDLRMIPCPAVPIRRFPPVTSNLAFGEAVPMPTCTLTGLFHACNFELTIIYAIAFRPQTFVTKIFFLP